MSLLPQAPGNISVPGLGGGRSLGTAQGSIRIDTSDAERARVTMQRVGQDIAKSVQPINTALRNAQRTIREFRTEIAAIGAVGGVISAIGISTAASFEEARVQLVGMTGDIRSAERLMDNLRDQAAEAGVPFADMLAATRTLLPTLEGNTAELEKWFDLVRRTSVLNQREGIAGAAFAINEALTSGGTDLVSLTERFNISRVALREALEETGGDFALALDMVLDRMGITTETADEMGRTFNASLRTARDAAAQLLAAGFQPLLDNGLTPLLQRTGEWLTQVRELRPEVATLGAAFATVAAVGAPTLLFTERLLSSLQKIATLSPTLAALGKSLGGLGLAGGLGVGLGIQATRAIGRATGNEELANANLQLLGERIAQGLVVITEQWARTQAYTVGILATIVDNWSEAIANMIRAAANWIRGISEMLPGENPRLDAAAEGAERMAQRLEDAGDKASQAILDASGEQLNAIRRFAFGLAGVQLGGLTRGQRADAARYQGQADAFAARPAAATTTGYSDEQMAVIMEFTDAIQQVERMAAEQRLEATRQYEEQRTQVIENYERQIARDAEDFARQRARDEEDLRRAIADVRGGQTEREADQIRDHNRRIADLQEDHARRLLQIQRDYNGRIREAASGLDARGVANLQRQRDDALRNENDSFRERFDQERESHQERIQLSREADEQRIRDMVASLRERQRREDEDRRIRLQRQADDHRRQLQLLDSAHRSRLSQIQQQAYNERRALLTAYQQRLADVGIHNRQYATLQQARQRESLRLFNRYFNEIVNMQNAMMAGLREVRTTSSGTTHIPGIPGRFADGGYVGYTGAALVHDGEYVLNPQTTSLIEQMLRGPITQPRLVGALAGGGGGSVAMTVNMPIYGAPGQSAQDIGAVVERKLTGLLNELGRRR